MSHFTVLVPANSQEELAAKLQPFHEYECTGTLDQYVQFVEANMEEVKADFEKYGEKQSIEEFMQDWYGYELNGDKWGRLTNPNKKWDWWVVGGRWSGTLLLKNGKTGSNGEGGLMSPANTDPTRADVAIAGDVDWQEMKHLQGEKAWSKHIKYHAIMLDKSLTDNEKQYKLSNEIGFYRDEDLDTMSAADYSEKHKNKAPVFAFIDMEGRWNQRGEMHWFAIVSDEQPDYDAGFWKFIESLPADQQVYVVDCHI